MTNTTNQNFWTRVKQQFRQNRRAMFAYRLIQMLVVVVVFASFIANDKPIFVIDEGKWMFPAVTEYFQDWSFGKPVSKYHQNWKEDRFDFIIRTPIPYKPYNLDTDNIHKSPFENQKVKSWYWHHWFGTSTLGKDVASSMIYGTRVALAVGLIAMLIATLLGVALGSLAGFFGDNKLYLSLASIILSIPTLVMAYFYAFLVRGYVLADAMDGGFFMIIGQWLLSLIIFVVVIGLGYFLSKILQKIPFLKRKVRIPLDIIISRIIEVFTAIPTLIFILAYAAVAKSASILNIMVIIGLVSWTGIARFMRGEMLRIRSLSYIEAAEALGYSQMRIMIRHAIPNGLSPVLIAVAFGIAGAILVEATLSFLGIGISQDVQTWGKVLFEAKKDALKWWLAVIPGFAIFLTVTCFNLIGEGLTDALDPKK